MLRSLIPVLLLSSLFLLSAYVAQTYEDYFIYLLQDTGYLGIIAYTALAMATTVVAPLTSVPLIPIVSNIWGPTTTAIASIIGWLTGALIAFSISRRYGRSLVEKLVSKEKLIAMEKRVPTKNLFWSIVLLRMAVPVDVLSYVLGLFSTISWKVYSLATLIGITPFAFVIAYAGTLPIKYQLAIFVIGAILILYLMRTRRSKTLRV